MTNANKTHGKGGVTSRARAALRWPIGPPGAWPGCRAFAVAWATWMAWQATSLRLPSPALAAPACQTPVEVRCADGVRLGCAEDVPAWSSLKLAPFDAVTLGPDGQVTRLPHQMGGGMRQLLGAPLDVNEATADELALLDGIGASRAAAIVAYREAHGPFPSVASLRQVPHLGEKLLCRLEAHLTAGP